MTTEPAAPATQRPADPDDPFAPYWPRRFGRFNGLGVWTLYSKEVQRFFKVWMQSVVAPVVTTLLFLAVFSVAFGAERQMAGGLPFADFLAPGLIMMAIAQNAFANTSSSILISKIQGNIVDVLMPPLSPGELTLCYTLGGVTRGLVVALVVAVGMSFFADLGIHNIGWVLYYAVAGALLLSLVGLIGGIWADKFDHLSAVTNFVVTPLAFLSGTFYSIDRLPGLLHDVSHVNPFFYLIDGFRAGFIGRADGDLWIGAGLIAALNLLLWVVSHQLLKRGWKLKA